MQAGCHEFGGETWCLSCPAATEPSLCALLAYTLKTITSLQLSSSSPNDICRPLAHGIWQGCSLLCAPKSEALAKDRAGKEARNGD